MRVPEGFETFYNEDKVLLLEDNLFGLKQAAIFKL